MTMPPQLDIASCHLTASRPMSCERIRTPLPHKAVEDIYSNDFLLNGTDKIRT